MIRPPSIDLWQVGIVPAPIATLLEPAALGALRARIAWLPEAGPWRYLADPFGVRRPDATHLFVEAFDYRTKHAVIEHHEFSPTLEWRARDVALARPFHLSYPFLIEQDGEVFMVPESHRANEVALYRARKFPGDWVRETVLLPDTPAADATLIQHNGRWWMFFSIVGPEARDQRELHVAYAPSLTGPWKRHLQNPVVEDFAGARPAGTPFIGPDGFVTLPVQDCSETYGGAVRFLRFTTLEPYWIAVEKHPARLTGDLASAAFPDGCHTISQCGDLTLIDVKRIRRTWSRYGIDLRRRAARFGLGRRQPATIA